MQYLDFPLSNPDSKRYFGDHPGQEATKAAIGRDDCQRLRRAVEDIEAAATSG